MSEGMLSQVQATPTPSLTPVRSGLLQRKCACGNSSGFTGKCEECGEQQLMQRHSTAQAGPSTVPPIVHEVLHSSGQPLDANTRSFMEQRFNHDFSQIRIHTDARAAESAQAVNAQAYTVGQNIVFDARFYSPVTRVGRKLLAHELTHTIQQQDGMPTTLEMANPNDVSEQEAQSISTRVEQMRSVSAASRRVAHIARQQNVGQAQDSRAQNGENKDLSPWEEGWDWLTGHHPEKRNFGSGDLMTEDLKKHEGIVTARTNAVKTVKETCSTNPNSTYLADPKGIESSLKGTSGVWKFIKDSSSLATFGLTGNLTATYLGSYHGDWNAKMNCCKGTGTIHFHVENKSGLTSATHFPILGYDRPRPTVGDWLTSPLETYEKWGSTLPGSIVRDSEPGSGPMSTVSMVFDWDEPVFFSPPIDCPGFPLKSFPAKSKDEESGQKVPHKSKVNSKPTVGVQSANDVMAVNGLVPQEVIDHIKLREGWEVVVYEDPKKAGKPTVGMGHLLTEAEKKQYKIGDKVPLPILKAWAQADAKKAYEAAVAQSALLGVSDQSFINAMASVNFQLGAAWNSKHKKTWAYMVGHEWDKAAIEAKDSLWYTQTPVRVKDFQAALRALSGVPATAVTAETVPAVAANTTYEFKIGAPTGQGSVTANSLNVRKGPGTNYDTRGTALKKGASLTIYGQVGDWHCIGSGQWVSGKFISIGKQETNEAKQQRVFTAHNLLANYATFVPYTSTYINLDEKGLARLLAIYAKFDGKLVLTIFDTLDYSDTDDVAFEMVLSTSDKDLSTFDHIVLSRMKVVLSEGWQTDEEGEQIARIDSVLGLAKSVGDKELVEAATSGVEPSVTIDDLKSQITAGKITFDEKKFKVELLGENKGTKVTALLQALVLEISKRQNIRISSIVRSEGHHGSGRAVDIGNESIAGVLLPEIATDAKVKELGIDELIFDATVAGQKSRNEWNYDLGKKHDYKKGTLDDHKDHIHFAVKAG